MGKVMLSYGSGGADSNDFIQNFILPNIYANTSLNGLNEDAAIIDESFSSVISTDSFVLSPIFINGADIGKIAACGSINDVLMMGAKPLYITLGLILEEGLCLNDLKTILNSFGDTLKQSGVKVICGDVKVVAKNKCDKIFINTTCIGKQRLKNIGLKYIRPNDVIVLSSDIGRHGACVMAKREGFELSIKTDAKSLHKEVDDLIHHKINIKTMRDATRGGLSAVLNEISNSICKKITIKEECITTNDEVMGLCELLGYDSMELANEGTFICIVDEKDADLTQQILQKYNKNAKIIGKITDENTKKVILENDFGSKICQMPRGELLPRIC